MAQIVFYPKTITINITSFKGAWRLKKVLKASRSNTCRKENNFSACGLDDPDDPDGRPQAKRRWSNKDVLLHETNQIVMQKLVNSVGVCTS